MCTYVKCFAPDLFCFVQGVVIFLCYLTTSDGQVRQGALGSLRIGGPGRQRRRGRPRRAGAGAADADGTSGSTRMMEETFHDGGSFASSSCSARPPARAGDSAGACADAGADADADASTNPLLPIDRSFGGGRAGRRDLKRISKESIDGLGLFFFFLNCARQAELPGLRIR